MKEKNEIFKEYMSNPGRPLFFGKEEHWDAYYYGYEMGYREALDESLNFYDDKLGMLPNILQSEIDEQFNVMKKALQQYYKEKGK